MIITLYCLAESSTLQNIYNRNSIISLVIYCDNYFIVNNSANYPQIIEHSKWSVLKNQERDLRTLIIS